MVGDLCASSPAIDVPYWSGHRWEGTSLVAIGEDHVDATALVLVDVAPRVETEVSTKFERS
jgi:hypothetical protein